MSDLDNTTNTLVIQFVYVAVSLIAAGIVWKPGTFGLRMRFEDAAGEFCAFPYDVFCLFFFFFSSSSSFFPPST